MTSLDEQGPRRRSTSSDIADGKGPDEKDPAQYKYSLVDCATALKDGRINDLLIKEANEVINNDKNDHDADYTCLILSKCDRSTTRAIISKEYELTSKAVVTGTRRNFHAQVPKERVALLVDSGKWHYCVDGECAHTIPQGDYHLNVTLVGRTKFSDMKLWEDPERKCRDFLLSNVSHAPLAITPGWDDMDHPTFEVSLQTPNDIRDLLRAFSGTTLSIKSLDMEFSCVLGKNVDQCKLCYGIHGRTCPFHDRRFRILWKKRGDLDALVEAGIQFDIDFRGAFHSLVTCHVDQAPLLVQWILGHPTLVRSFHREAEYLNRSASCVRCGDDHDKSECVYGFTASQLKKKEHQARVDAHNLEVRKAQERVKQRLNLEVLSIVKGVEFSRTFLSAWNHLQKEKKCTYLHKQGKCSNRNCGLDHPKLSDGSELRDVSSLIQIPDRKVCFQFWNDAECADPDCQFLHVLSWYNQEKLKVFGQERVNEVIAGTSLAFMLASRSVDDWLPEAVLDAVSKRLILDVGFNHLTKHVLGKVAKSLVKSSPDDKNLVFMSKVKTGFIWSRKLAREAKLMWNKADTHVFIKNGGVDIPNQLYFFRMLGNPPPRADKGAFARGLAPQVWTDLETKSSVIHGNGVFTKPAADSEKDELTARSTIYSVDLGDHTRYDKLSDVPKDKLWKTLPIANIKGSYITLGDEISPLHYVNHSESPNCKISVSGNNVNLSVTKKCTRGQECVINYGHDLCLLSVLGTDSNDTNAIDDACMTLALAENASGQLFGQGSSERTAQLTKILFTGNIADLKQCEQQARKRFWGDSVHGLDEDGSPVGTKYILDDGLLRTRSSVVSSRQQYFNGEATSNFISRSEADSIQYYLSLSMSGAVLQPPISIEALIKNEKGHN